MKSVLNQLEGGEVFIPCINMLENYHVISRLMFPTSVKTNSAVA